MNSWVHLAALLVLVLLFGQAVRSAQPALTAGGGGPPRLGLGGVPRFDVSQSRSVMVWMGLEVTGEDVPGDLALIHYYRSDLTAVSYEQYELGADAAFTPIPGISNITGAVEGDGLQAWPMIISASLPNIEALLENQSGFISEAVSTAVRLNFTGYNVDFEPTAMANASVAQEYARFLDNFASALHEAGRKLSVDIASWNTFWNFTALANTSVDTFYDMDTYAASFADFESALSYANSTLPHPKLGVGLITQNVNTGATLSYGQVEERFALVEDYGVRSISIWDMPLPTFWWNLTASFLNTSLGGIPPLSVESYTLTPTVFDSNQTMSTTLSLTVEGGLPPYLYELTLDGRMLFATTTPQPNLTLTLPLGALSVGDHTFSVAVTDQEDTTVRTPNQTIEVNPDPQITLFTTNTTNLTLGGSALVQVRVVGGTPPYTYTWYLNGEELPASNTSTMVFNPSKAGDYQLYVEIRDSAGYTLVSKTQSLLVESPTPSYTMSSHTSPTPTHNTGIETPWTAGIVVGIAVLSLLLLLTRRVWATRLSKN